MKKITTLLLGFLFLFVSNSAIFAAAGPATPKPTLPGRPKVLAATSAPTASPTPIPSPTPVPLNQEELNVNRAIDDYKFALDVYKKADSEYQIAKAQYLNSKTLTAQAKVQGALYSFLRSRDELLRTYLVYLNVKIAATQGVSDSDRDSTTARLQESINWYADHEERLKSAGNLADLFKDSDEAKVYYFNNTDPIIYKSLSLVPDARIQTFQDRIRNIVDATSAKIAEIRQNQDKDTRTIERWILETQSRIQRSVDKKNSAHTDIFPVFDKIDNTYTQSRSSSYNDVVFRLEESLQYLKEANIFLKEIVNKIKSTD